MSCLPILAYELYSSTLLVSSSLTNPSCFRNLSLYCYCSFAIVDQTAISPIFVAIAYAVIFFLRLADFIKLMHLKIKCLWPPPWIIVENHHPIYFACFVPYLSFVEKDWTNCVGESNSSLYYIPNIYFRFPQFFCLIDSWHGNYYFFTRINCFARRNY